MRFKTAGRDITSRIEKLLPILIWGKAYSRPMLSSDLIAASIVTIMLIPQSLAYAMLAGLPPEVGLYASIWPLFAYAIFGTSHTLAVGPVAIVSLMTASAVGGVADQGSVDYLTAAAILALLSGGMLALMGAFRLGFFANFLSHPVISGFITASGLLIAAGQIKHLLGIPLAGTTLPEILAGIEHNQAAVNLITLAIGCGTILLLHFSRSRAKGILIAMNVSARIADLVTKAVPILVVSLSIILVTLFDLGQQGVALVGFIPDGLPSYQIPNLSVELVLKFLGPAFLISVIGFVESVSIAQTLASKRRQRIGPDNELFALGAANIASGLSSGFPVSGGFARSVVNYSAGAETPAAGIFTAIGIALAAVFLTPLLANLPQATLAATIIMAVLSLVDFSAILRVAKYSKADFAAMAATILTTLIFGVERGVMAGVLLSLLLHLYRSSRPHMAVVGQVPGTEHFRNTDRHPVITDPGILSIRVDESLYFANSRYLQDRIIALVAEYPKAKHVILMCPAINAIDTSALECLEEINHRLKCADITFHLSEVKGPVMDKLRRTDFLQHLTGQVFLSQFEAVSALSLREANRQPI